MAITHLIIGAGNMGGAVFSSWIAKGVVDASHIAISDPNPGPAAKAAFEAGATHLGSDDPFPDSVEYVMLGIKPQLFQKIGTDLAKRIPDGALILSIMAGTSTKSLQSAFSGHPVIRAMPNMPASLSKGMTGFVASDDATRLQVEHITACLEACGEVIQVGSDADIDSVTAVSGSGPAYVFHMVEAMSEAGTSLGLDADMAAKLARNTIIGAAAQLEASDDSAGDLRKAVTSPNGTTQAALDELMGDDRLIKLMGDAVKAAKRRAEELSD